MSNTSNAPVYSSEEAKNFLEGYLENFGFAVSPKINKFYYGKFKSNGRIVTFWGDDGYGPAHWKFKSPEGVIKKLKRYLETNKRIENCPKFTYNDLLNLVEICEGTEFKK